VSFFCRVQKLKEFKKTLLLAHEKAFNDMQQESSSSSEFPQLSGNQGTVDSQQHNLSCNADVSSQANVASSSKSMGAGADSQAGCDSPQVISKTIISDDRDIAALEMAASLHLPVDELPWTCSTCVDAKFTSKFPQPASAAGTFILLHHLHVNGTWYIYELMNFNVSFLNVHSTFETDTACGAKSEEQLVDVFIQLRAAPSTVDLEVDLHALFVSLYWCKVVVRVVCASIRSTCPSRPKVHPIRLMSAR
jgi:hypothetical protein